MKLYNRGWGGPCGISAISILTGWTHRSTHHRIIQLRKSYPLDSKGFKCNKTLMYQSTNSVFLNEVVRVLKQKDIHTRFRHTYAWTKLLHLPKYFFKGTWLLYLPEHLIVLQDGEVYDNYETGQEVKFSHQRFCPVICYARIQK